jgi:hypothetical protein
MTEDTRPQGTRVLTRPHARPGAAVRAFRPRRTIPAAIASIALLAAGLLTALEAITALWGRPAQIVPIDDLTRWAGTTTWQDKEALGSAGLATLLGLLLLLIAAVAGRPRVIALRTGDDDLVAGVSPRMLSRLLTDAAERVDGVRRARVKVRGRRVTAKATTDLREAAGLKERVRAAVEQEIDYMAPVGRYTVRVRVRTPS